MASMNKVSIIGNIGKDPELRHTGGGTPVCSLSVATNESWTGKDGQKAEHTEWHRVVVWGAVAQATAQYCKKGRQVYIEGKLRTRQFEDKDKVQRKVTEIVAHQVLFLGSNGNGHGPAAEAAEADQSLNDEDVPF